MNNIDGIAGFLCGTGRTARMCSSPRPASWPRESTRTRGKARSDYCGLCDGSDLMFIVLSKEENIRIRILMIRIFISIDDTIESHDNT
jgi:hypothetical protein